MTDTPNQDSDEAATGPVAGGRLAAARIGHDITCREIAKELHLDEPTVLAIEQNNFEALGAPVFAKGHLRKYAELVGVSVDDVLTDYYQLTRAVAMPPVVAPTRSVERSIAPGPWIVVGLLLLVAGGAAYWWFTRPPAALVAVPDPTALAPFAGEPSPAVNTVADDEPADLPVAADAVETSTEGAVTAAEPDTAGAGDDETVAAPQTERPAAAAPTADSSPPAERPVQVTAATARTPQADQNLGPRVVLELVFSGDCWAEINDAAGRRLFYDLGTAGEIASVSGVAPFQVVLGDSSNVTMTVDGRDYFVPPTSPTDGLTRLTVRSQ